MRPRLYHSSAVLLPSCQVMVSGSDVTGDTTAEVYSPVSFHDIANNCVVEWVGQQGSGRQGGQVRNACAAQRTAQPGCLRLPVASHTPQPSSFACASLPPHLHCSPLPLPPPCLQPHLFRGPRPVVVSGSDAIVQGQDLKVQYTSQDPVTKALLIRTSATTHSMAFGEWGAEGEQRLAVLCWAALGLCRAPFASSPCSVQLASVRRPSI